MATANVAGALRRELQFVLHARCEAIARLDPVAEQGAPVFLCFFSGMAARFFRIHAPTVALNRPG